MSCLETAILIRASGREVFRRESRLVQMRNAGTATFLGRRDGHPVYKEKVPGFEEIYWWNGSCGRYDPTRGPGRYDKRGPVMRRPGEVVS